MMNNTKAFTQLSVSTEQFESMNPTDSTPQTGAVMAFFYAVPDVLPDKSEVFNTTEPKAHYEKLIQEIQEKAGPNVSIHPRDIRFRKEKMFLLKQKIAQSKRDLLSMEAEQELLKNTSFYDNHATNIYIRLNAILDAENKATSHYTKKKQKKQAADDAIASDDEA